jgi:hypothetical protein
VTVDISRLDVPAAVVEAEACYRKAADRTNSPSDRLACYLDIRLEQHPELLATEADYPEWAAQFAAAREADNRRTREAAS